MPSAVKAGEVASLTYSLPPSLLERRHPRNQNYYVGPSSINNSKDFYLGRRSTVSVPWSTISRVDGNSGSRLARWNLGLGEGDHRDGEGDDGEQGSLHDGTK